MILYSNSNIKFIYQKDDLLTEMCTVGARALTHCAQEWPLLIKIGSISAAFSAKLTIDADFLMDKIRFVLAFKGQNNRFLFDKKYFLKAESKKTMAHFMVFKRESKCKSTPNLKFPF